MPKITQYTRENIDGGNISVTAGADAFGGNQAGLQAQASALGDLSRGFDVVGQEFQKIQLRREASDYTAAMAQRSLELMKVSEGMKNQDFGENADIPATYEQYFGELSKDWGKDVPASQREKFAGDLANMKQHFVMAGYRDNAERVALKTRTNYENTVTAATNMATMNPALQSQAMALVEEQINNLPMNPEQRAALLDKGRDSIRGAVAGNLSSNNPSAFIAAAKAGKYNDLPDLDRYIARAEAEIKQKSSEAKLAVREESSNIINLIESGVPVSSEQIQGARQRAASLGMDNVVKVFDEAVAVDKFRVEAAITPSALRNEELTKLMGNTADTSPERLAKIKILSTMQDKEAAAYEQGELLDLYTARQGIAALPPLDLNNPEALSLQLKKYRAAADNATEYFGVRAAPFTKQQLNTIAEDYKTATPEKAMALTSVLSANLAPEELGVVGRSLQKANIPIGVAALKMKDDPEVARWIVDGAKRPDVVPRKDLKDAIYPMLGTVVRDPQAYADIEQTVINTYKGMAVEADDTNDAVATDRLEMAIKRTLGGDVIEVGKSKILPFTLQDNRIADTDVVEMALRQSSLDTMSKLGIEPPLDKDGTPVDIAARFKGLRFVTVGVDGLVNVEHKDSGYIYRDSQNRKYTLNLKDLISGISNQAELRRALGEENQPPEIQVPQVNFND